MTSKTKFRPSPALAISCVALFLALVGTAFAAPQLAVRSAQIVNGTIRTADIAKDAVKSPKIADATVNAADLGTDSVGSDEIAKDAVNSDEIADNAVTSAEVAPDSLTAGDLAANSVGASEVADESLTQNDLGANSVGASELQANSVAASELGGTVVRTKSEPIAAGANGTISVDCQAGEQMISGGGAPSAFGVEMVTNAPSGNGWFYAASNKTGANHSITVYAVCLG